MNPKTRTQLPSEDLEEKSEAGQNPHQRKMPPEEMERWVDDQRRIFPGKDFGMLVALKKDNSRKWIFLCRWCGSEKSIYFRSVLSGKTISCGCKHLESLKMGLKRSHGLSKEFGKRKSEYGIWLTMKQRCLNPKNKNFHNYGGRGIYIDKRWVDSFSVFYSDMGPKPSRGHSIHRIDNNGPYSKENCEWAIQETQSNCKRGSRLITFRGETKTIAQWSRSFNIIESALRGRIDLGWTMEEAISTPLRKNKTRKTT